MFKITHNEMLKDARKIARDNGLTLKIDNACRINGATAYCIIDRNTGLTVSNWDNMTLDCAYQTLLANY